MLNFRGIKAREISRLNSYVLNSYSISKILVYYFNTRFSLFLCFPVICSAHSAFSRYLECFMRVPPRTLTADCRSPPHRRVAVLPLPRRAPVSAVRHGTNGDYPTGDPPRPSPRMLRRCPRIRPPRRRTGQLSQGLLLSFSLCVLLIRISSGPDRFLGL